MSQPTPTQRHWSARSCLRAVVRVGRLFANIRLAKKHAPTVFGRFSTYSSRTYLSASADLPTPVGCAADETVLLLRALLLLRGAHLLRPEAPPLRLRKGGCTSLPLPFCGLCCCSSVLLFCCAARDGLRHKSFVRSLFPCVTFSFLRRFFCFLALYLFFTFLTFVICPSKQAGVRVRVRGACACERVSSTTRWLR